MRVLIFLLILLVAVPAFAHDCICGGMDRLSAETIQRMKWGKKLRVELDVACTHAQQLGEMRDGVTQGSYQYWRAYQYWTERCEKLQEVLIDEAY